MADEQEQEAIITITVKTLDGQNRTFHVAENLNVRQFKEHISTSIEIPADSQRLIFQGRVMQDEKHLTDYDVHGKVIHLVQRAPPMTSSGASNSTSTTTSTPPAGRHVPLDGNLFDVQIHLGRVQSAPNTREARSRIRQADFNLRLVNDVLNQMEQRSGSQSSGNAAQSTSNIASNQSDDRMDSSTASEGEQPVEIETRGPTGHQPPSGSEPAGGLTGDQRTGLMATELANFLDQILSTNDRVTSHIRLYRDLLRNEVSYTAMSREAQDAQEVVSRATEVFHALGHMLHSLSDVVVDMNTDLPRQAVASPPVPFPIPGTASMAIPIHMNVRARQNANGQRQNQSTSTTSSTTASSTTTTTSTPSAIPTATTTSTSTSNTANTVNVAASLGPFQIPPVSLSLPPPASSTLTTVGDPTVMVEVFPTGVAVHDIRTMVTQGGLEEDSDSSTDSVDNAGGSQTNITITSTNVNQPPTTTSTVSSTGAQPDASAPRTTAAGSFTSTTSSPSAFIIGPTASVSFRELPSFSVNQMPNVPGLPQGMLQNILGSILNSHGVRPDQAVQINVVQQMSATGTPTTRAPQTVQDVPLDTDRGTIRPQRLPLGHPRPTIRTSGTQQSPPSADVNTGTRAASSTTLATSTTTTSSSASLNPPFTFNLSNLGSPSSISMGTGPEPNSDTGNQATGNARPQFHVHLGNPGQLPRPPRPQTQPPPMRSGLGGPRGYVDPYLPCSSPHYLSQTALTAFNAMQGQSRGRGQPPQQQIPHLSTMVSGMVGEIMEQVGQAVNSGARAGSGVITTSTTGSNTTSGSTTTGIDVQQLNPLEMLSHVINSGDITGALGTLPVNIGNMEAMINSNVHSASNPGAAPTSNRGVTTPRAWTLADLFTQVRPVTDDSTGDENVIIALLEAVAPHMGLTDLFSLVMGNTRVLNQVRRPLLEYVRRQVAHYGSVDQMVEAALSDMYPEIEHLQSLVQLRDGMDLAQSLRNCLRVHLATVFTAINSDNSGSQGDFGIFLYSLWMKMLADSIGLCIYCIQDGRVGFSNMVQNYMPRMTQGMSPAITIWMTTSLQDILESFHQNHPVTESDITSYLVRRPERPVENSHVEVAPAVNNISPRPILAMGDAALRFIDIRTSPGPMDTSESTPLSQLPSAKTPRTVPEDDADGQEIFEDAQESFTNRPNPPQERPNTISTHINRTDGAVGGSRDIRSRRSADDWQSVIPRDWIPVISRDIVRQQNQRPQPPHSDAYLQGLPAKRRRMMTLEHAVEVGNMPLYLPSSLTRAAQAADVEPISSEENMAREAADDHDLQAELEREVTRVLASRITSDQDFNSERFPNAKEYFHKSNHR